MARATRSISSVILLSAACAVARGGAAAGQSPVGPPERSVRILVLERRGYRVGENPPAAALYAATDAGIFRGEGDGAWVRVDSEPGSAAVVTALAIFQRERPVEEPVVAHRTWMEYETTLYAGTPTGLLRSVDGGSTWRSVSAVLAGVSVRSLLFDRAGTVYLVTSDGEIFRGADRGERWVRAGQGLPKPVRCVAADPTRAGVLYAGAGAGLFRSPDGGKTWSALRVEGGELDFAADSVAVDPDSPARIFAAGLTSRAGSSTPAAFASADGGNSWRRLARTVEGPLLFDRGSPSHLYACAAGRALESPDGGSTWGTPGDAAAPIAAVLAVDPDWPGRLYGRALDGGVVRLQARCGGDAGALCLRGGRFLVQLDWDGDSSGAGPPAATAVIAADDGQGSFWLARPSNIVLTVQIRDAPANPGHFWIDFDARTSRRFGVVVTDMATGTSTRYSHPEGQRTRFTDHGAF